MVRPRRAHWPMIRTATLALAVGAVSVTGPSLAAAAQEPRPTEQPVEHTARSMPAEDDGADSDTPLDEDSIGDPAVLDETEESDDEGVEESDDEVTGEPADDSPTDDLPAGLHRIEGGDRVATSVAVARDRFPDGEPSAVLASADDFADALAGSALADHVSGPLLLTETDALDPRVAAELEEQLPAGATVWLLGGPDALDEEVATAVADLGLGVERLAGPDRYGTAAAISRQITAEGREVTPEVILATGTSFADGASASGFASASRVLMFTRGEKMPAATGDELARLADGAGGAGRVAVTAVGGGAAAALERAGSELPEQLATTSVVGEDRYATSAHLLTLVRGDGAGTAESAPESGPVTLTSGLDYPDALIGGTYGHPVVLTEPTELPRPVAEALADVQGALDGLLVVGGTESVPEDVAQTAASLADEDGPAAAPPATSADEEAEAEDEEAEDAEATGSATPAPRATAEPSSEDGLRTPTSTTSPGATGTPGPARTPSSNPTSDASSTSGSTSGSSTSAPTSTTGGGSIDAEWRAAKATGSEKAVRAFFAKWVDPDPVVRRTVTGKVTIDTQAEADAARGTKYTGEVTITGGVHVRDAVFEHGRVHVVDADLTDVLFDGADQTYKAWNVDFRGESTLTRVEFRRMQDAMKVDRERSRITARYVMIHEPSQQYGSLKGNNTHQDGVQVQAGSFDFQKGMLDYRGNHSGGQGMIFGGDSGTMGDLVVKDSFLTSDHNMLTFQRRGPGRFPRSIDFGSVAAGDHNLVAPGPKMKNALSMYINAPVRMTGADQADITEHSFKDVGGRTQSWKNGIRKENLS